MANIKPYLLKYHILLPRKMKSDIFQGGGQRPPSRKTSLFIFQRSITCDILCKKGLNICYFINSLTKAKISLLILSIF